MLTNQSKYAIRAVLYLAVYTDKNKKIGSKEVAKKINIPAPFLAKILQKLVKGKLISSTKGPNGGFYLTEKDLLNSMLDTVRVIEGLDLLSECFLGLPRCGDENPCAIHHLISPFKNTLLKEMGDKTIAQYAEETKTGKYFLFLDDELD
ncbi:MAG TPA: Rrf2 family transcriptional regulator [Flavobacteriaceae bacterium]|nr:Rrf2 family transcriptional regulator [Flavobacteriaceae bacterium]